MYCSNCGQSIPDDAVFCPDCGGYVKHAVAIDRQSKTLQGMNDIAEVVSGGAESANEKIKGNISVVRKKVSRISSNGTRKIKAYQKKILAARENRMPGQQSLEKEDYCPHCGALLVAGAKFCVNCGKAVSGFYALDKDSENEDEKAEKQNESAIERIEPEKQDENIVERIAPEKQNKGTEKRIDREEQRKNEEENIEQGKMMKDIGGTSVEKHRRKKKVFWVLLPAAGLAAILFSLLPLTDQNKDKINNNNITTYSTLSATNNNSESEKVRRVSSQIESVASSTKALSNDSIEKEHSYVCGKYFNTNVSDDVILMLCRDSNFTSLIRKDNITVMQQKDPVEINGVSCDWYIIEEKSSGKKEEIGRYAYDSDNDVIYEFRNEEWRSVYGKAPNGDISEEQEGENAVEAMPNLTEEPCVNAIYVPSDSSDSLRYSDEELLELVSSYISTFAEPPSSYTITDINENEVEINAYNGSVLYMAVYLNPNNGDGNIGSEEGESVHFANYRKEYFLLPYVGERGYSEDEIESRFSEWGYTKEESNYFIRLCINEIYARHGRIFQTDEIRNYFNQFPWYSGSVEGSEMGGNENSYFNSYEYVNFNMLLELQKKYQ